jgi:nicotinate-nucleotide adenylyltransferase
VKIGVFGGTFDPVHWGHLVLAEEARTAAGLDRVLFVPSALPPHKQDRRLTPFPHRLAMLKAALAGSPEFDVSDIESDESRPHFSLDTLTRLSELHAGDDLSFIIGSDSLLELPGWRGPHDIVRRWPLVVLVRPGAPVSAADPAFTGSMTVVDGIQVSVSSTLVRKRLAAGAPARFLVPEPVLGYVREHGLYGVSR